MTESPKCARCESPRDLTYYMVLHLALREAPIPNVEPIKGHLCQRCGRIVLAGIIEPHEAPG